MHYGGADLHQGHVMEPSYEDLFPEGPCIVRTYRSLGPASDVWVLPRLCIDVSAAEPCWQPAKCSSDCLQHLCPPGCILNMIQLFLYSCMFPAAAKPEVQYAPLRTDKRERTFVSLIMCPVGGASQTWLGKNSDSLN